MRNLDWLPAFFDGQVPVIIRAVADDDVCPRLGEGFRSVILSADQGVDRIAPFEKLAGYVDPLGVSRGDAEAYARWLSARSLSASSAKTRSVSSTSSSKRLRSSSQRASSSHDAICAVRATLRL